MDQQFQVLTNRLAERGYDKRFPGAAASVNQIGLTHDRTRTARDAVRSDKNLTPAGQRVKIMEHLDQVAPVLGKQRRMIESARTTIEKKRASMRPKFEKVDPAILIAVASKIATMKPHEQAALLSVERGVDPIHAKAVLELPPILTGVGEQIRVALETGLIEKTHGAALTALEDERQAWNVAEAALRTAENSLREAGDFPSPHAFNLWLEKATPPDASALAAEKRELEEFTAQAALIAAASLSHDTRMKLHSDLLDQAGTHLKHGGD